MKRMIALGLLALGMAALLHEPASADDEADLKKSIARGLDWLAAQQFDDGRWDAMDREGFSHGRSEPTGITALVALTLLMEGSNLREGKYSAHLTRTVDYFLKNARADGLLKGDKADDFRYMFGHSYGMLFLSQVLDVEKEGKRRRHIEKVLARAVEFSGKAQTKRGGWGYVAGFDSSDYDEGCVTTAQIRALFAARNAGVPVPRALLDKAVGYLEKATTARGGVVYSLAVGKPQAGGERPPLTVAALSCLVVAGRHDAPVFKQWLAYSQKSINADGLAKRFGFDEYIHHHYAEALHGLGDRRVRALAGDIKDPTTWSTYRQKVFPAIVQAQKENGSWRQGSIGPVYTTAAYLSVLQLETSPLPLHQP